MRKEKVMSNMEKKFEADTGKILDIVINSLYSEREIFVRELITISRILPVSASNFFSIFDINSSLYIVNTCLNWLLLFQFQDIKKTL